MFSTLQNISNNYSIRCEIINLIYFLKNDSVTWSYLIVILSITNVVATGIDVVWFVSWVVRNIQNEQRNQLSFNDD